MMRSSPRTDGLLLGLMMLAWWSMLPWSSVHLDFSRDLALAADILEGLSAPLTGPLLAGWAHLGPAWYYLLAALLWLGQDYLGVVLLLGILGASQFVFVYLAGREWAGREAGLIWAALLLLPSWRLYESFLVTHTLLTAPLVALGLWVGIRWVRRGRPIDLLLLSLACSLGLHAHPSILGLLPLAVVAALAGLRHRPAWWWWILAAVLAALPFLPVLYEQWQGGWSLWSEAREYRASADGQGSLAAVPELIWQLGVGGLVQWLESVLGWPGLVVMLVVGLKLLLVLTTVWGLVRRWREGVRIDAVMIGGLVLALVVLALLRAVYPYWFLSGIQVLWLGLLAVGLAGLARAWRPAPAFVSLFAVVAILAQLGATSSVLSLQRQAAWPFAVFPAFDVTAETMRHQPVPFLTIGAAGSSGRWLCAQPEVVMHGALAQSLAMSYGLQRRLACDSDLIRLAGTDPGREHWAGLSVSMLGELGLTPSLNWTGFGLVRVLPVWPEESLLMPGERPYPHLPVPSTAPERVELVIEPAVGRLVAITHLGFMLSARPEPELYCGRQPVPAAAVDGLSTVFRLPPCNQALQLVFETPDPVYVDVFLIE